MRKDCSSSQLRILKSFGCLISKLSPITKAETTEPEVLRLHPLPLQRLTGCVGATAIVCCAGVLPSMLSEDPRKP